MTSELEKLSSALQVDTYRRIRIVRMHGAKLPDDFNNFPRRKSEYVGDLYRTPAQLM
jgi:hypothetical protein